MIGLNRKPAPVRKQPEKRAFVIPVFRFPAVLYRFGKKLPPCSCLSHSFPCTAFPMKENRFAKKSDTTISTGCSPVSPKGIVTHHNRIYFGNSGKQVCCIPPVFPANRVFSGITDFCRFLFSPGTYRQKKERFPLLFPCFAFVFRILCFVLD